MQQFLNNILFVVKSCIDLNVHYMYIYVCIIWGFICFFYCVHVHVKNNNTH